VTSVIAVSGEARTAEVSRMLSGAETEASRKHALELLEAAGSDVVHPGA
jgi:DNA repair ATPase RecN